jgi:hypothetical protein
MKASYICKGTSDNWFEAMAESMTVDDVTEPSWK